MLSRGARIALVSGGLLLAGAVLGALAASAALGIGAALSGQLASLDAGAFLLAAIAGAVFGGVLLPLTGFVLLRRVPLGLTFAGTLLGTLLGGAAGWLAAGRGPGSANWFAAMFDGVTNAVDQMNWAIGGALLGYALAVLVLRLLVGRREARVRVPSPTAR